MTVSPPASTLMPKEDCPPAPYAISEGSTAYLAVGAESIFRLILFDLYTDTHE